MVAPSQMVINQKYTCYSKQEIQNYLDKIKKSIKLNNYVVTKRKNGENKNQAFIKKYELSSLDIKNILLKIQVEDFCYTMLDDHNYQEVLYVFAKNETLWNPEVDEEDKVFIYIKTCYKEDSGYTVVVSFHAAEYPVKYAFV